jgi:hypothetical protein
MSWLAQDGENSTDDLVKGMEKIMEQSGMTAGPKRERPTVSALERVRSAAPLPTDRFLDRQGIADALASAGPVEAPATAVALPPTPEPPQPPEATKTNAADILSVGAETFRRKNLEYGDNYRNVGPAFVALFPEGLTLRTSDDFIRFHLFMLSIVKHTRYAVNFSKGHPDSTLDDMVYAAMLHAHDLEVFGEEP